MIPASIALSSKNSCRAPLHVRFVDIAHYTSRPANPGDWRAPSVARGYFRRFILTAYEGIGRRSRGLGRAKYWDFIDLDMGSTCRISIPTRAGRHCQRPEVGEGYQSYVARWRKSTRNSSGLIGSGKSSPPTRRPRCWLTDFVHSDMARQPDAWPNDANMSIRRVK